MLLKSKRLWFQDIASAEQHMFRFRQREITKPNSHLIPATIVVPAHFRSNGFIFGGKEIAAFNHSRFLLRGQFSLEILRVASLVPLNS
jgi:hypothetical protein